MNIEERLEAVSKWLVGFVKIFIYVGCTISVLLGRMDIATFAMSVLIYMKVQGL